jgi:SNF2 family DNA or RNA helicase
MAYHLSQEARAGLSEFRIPAEFRSKLFEFQSAAVRIAAHHLNKRNGVLIGDVVGLGKTLMATALARIVQEDQGISTLILCPKNLTKMWQHHADTYGLQAKVISLSKVVRELPNVPGRFRLIVLDESHNLRNREGKRYRAIHEFIQQTASRCVLLSATPYNKTYLDLGSQLRLFVADDYDLGIRPERLFRERGEVEFGRLQVAPRSLAAFERSPYADD